MSDYRKQLTPLDIDGLYDHLASHASDVASAHIVRTEIEYRIHYFKMKLQNHKLKPVKLLLTLQDTPNGL